MRKDLLQLLEYGKNKQLAISIVSNGLLLTKELIAELNKKDLDTFWISLDGLEANHDRLRGNGTYKKALNALRLLQQEFNSKKAIRVSLNKYNVVEYRDLIKIAEDLSVDIIRFTPLLSFGRAKDKELIISQDQFISFLEGISEIKSNVEIIYPNKSNNGKFWINSNDFGCHYGKEAVWIDERGNYYPCIFFGDSYILGNIKTDNYIELWEKSLSISNINGNDICKNYSVCRGGCRARVLEKFGNMNEIDPLCSLKKNLVLNS